MTGGPRRYCWQVLWTAASLGMAAALGVAISYDDRVPLGMAVVAFLALVPKGWLLAGAIVSSRWLRSGVSVTDVLLVAWLVRTVLPRWPRLTHGSPLLLGFLGWAWLGVALVGGQPLALGRVTLYAVVALVAHRDRDEDRPPVLLAILAYAAVELALTAPDLLRVVTGDRTDVRILGATVKDPHLFAFLLLAAYCILRFGAVHISGRVLRISLQALLMVGAMATMRRLVWLAILVVLFLPRLRLRRPAHLVIASVAMAVMAWALYVPVTNYLDLSDSRPLRATANRTSLDQAAQHPLLGIGWGSENRESASNLPVSLAATTGLLGAALLFGWLAAAGRRLWHAGRRATFWWLLALMTASVGSQPIYAGSMATIMLFVLVGLDLTPSAGPQHRQRAVAASRTLALLPAAS